MCVPYPSYLLYLAVTQSTRDEYLFDAERTHLFLVEQFPETTRRSRSGEPAKPLNDPSGLHAERTRVYDSAARTTLWEFCGKKTVFWKLCESSVLPSQNFSGNREQIPLAIY